MNDQPKAATPLELAQMNYDAALKLQRELASTLRNHDTIVTAAAEELNRQKMKAAEAIPVDRTARVLVGGRPVTEDHRELKPNGEQKDYVVLSAAERAKGFVRPVRRTYLHVGTGGPKGETRHLTAEETERYSKFGYALFEKYGPEREPIEGKFWTQAELDRTKGCGQSTTMSQEIAETYARDPKFYGGTFCCGCGKHFPIGADGEFEWEDGSKVGT